MTPPLPPARAARGPRVAMVVEQLWQPVPGGSGTYVVELSRALAADGARLAGIAAAHGPSPSPQELGLPAQMPVRGTRLPRTLLYEAWNRLGVPRAEQVLPGAQVVHATTWAVPSTRLPLAVTVHDLAFLRSPEHFTRRGNAYFRRCLERTAAEADVVITPSQATADDCVAAGVDARRVEVVPHGVRTREVAPHDVTSFRETYGVPGDYVLWTGTREPRKNLVTLLRAFSLLTDGHPGLDLVLVGPQGWGDDAEEQALLRSLDGRVHVTGRLSDEALAAAYTGARAFCFPSHWEGFGLPVLEAMAYGAPVVTSRGTCMEEVCAHAGLLADPTSAQEVAAQLALAAGPAHDELREAGLDRAAAFTWRACARAHANLYEQLAGGLR